MTLILQPDGWISPKRISPTRLEIYGQCPRKFGYRELTGLIAPAARGPALGTCLHDVMYQAYVEARAFDAITPSQATITEVQHLGVDELWARAKHAAVPLLRGMPERDTVEILEAEQEQILHTPYGQINLRPDLILRYKSTGTVEVNDYKTTRDWIWMPSAEDARAKLQTICYGLYAWQRYQTHEGLDFTYRYTITDPRATPEARRVGLVLSDYWELCHGITAQREAIAELTRLYARNDRGTELPMWAEKFSGTEWPEPQDTPPCHAFAGCEYAGPTYNASNTGPCEMPGPLTLHELSWMIARAPERQTTIMQPQQSLTDVLSQFSPQSPQPTPAPAEVSAPADLSAWKPLPAVAVPQPPTVPPGWQPVYDPTVVGNWRVVPAATPAPAAAPAPAPAPAPAAAPAPAPAPAAAPAPRGRKPRSAPTPPTSVEDAAQSEAPSTQLEVFVAFNGVLHRLVPVG